jgi:hypothetical protein
MVITRASWPASVRLALQATIPAPTPIAPSMNGRSISPATNRRARGARLRLPECLRIRLSDVGRSMGRRLRAESASVLCDAALKSGHEAPTFLEGPLDALADFYEALHRNPPSLWWPGDHAWCVGTGIDLMTTYIGGSPDAIDALLAAEQIEVLAVPVDQSITWEADAINPLPNPP